jgi:ATP-binding cassette, subfamily F, member 3
MSGIDVDSVFMSTVGGSIDDDDVCAYLCSVLSEMDIEELRNFSSLEEVVAPFLVESGSYDEDAAAAVCRSLVQAFGGSGYSGAGAEPVVSAPVDDTPELLVKAIKLNDTEEVKQLNKKGTYTTSTAQTIAMGDMDAIDGGALESQMAPATKALMRKRRQEAANLERKLRAEAERRADAARELRNARLAVVKASRRGGGAHKTGVNIDSFSLAHPSGRGDMLTDAKLQLVPGRKYGLVGRNGAGKSTLMRGLAMYQLPNLNHLRILLVDQHVEGDAKSALDWVLDADVERSTLLEEEARLSMYVNPDSNTVDVVPPLPSDLKGVDLTMALTEVWHRMDVLEVRTAEQRARTILKGLGFTTDMMVKPTVTLSGGWSMRAALAAAIFVNPDLLLLDEPTNHLDLHALVWLEDWLVNTFTGMLVVVSHDSHFLDSVCTDVIEFRSTLSGAKRSSLITFSGDYSTYERTLMEKRINLVKERDTYERTRDHLQEFIAREGKKYDNPSHQAQRKMKMKQLAALEPIEVPEDDENLVLKLPKPHGIFSGNERLLSIKGVSFAWPMHTEDDEAAKTPVKEQYYPALFEDVDFIVQSRARIAILGRNGCGKTSLLNLLLAGECNMPNTVPTTGSVSKLPGCRVTMLQQHHYKGEQLDPDCTPLEHIRALPQDASSAVGENDPGSRHEDAAMRGYLANFGIRRDSAILPVKYLSGGQRMRVALATAFFRRPDVLILDEPTNHLDADTVRALCESLRAFQGTIIAVSHDEAFVNRVIAATATTGASTCSSTDADAGLKALGGEIWVMESRKVTRFDGTFSGYKRKIRQQMLSQIAKSPKN